ncbi:MAG: InlB B-repeat-containing protein [Ruminococcus sp.]
MMKISKSKFVKSAISILLVVMMLLSAGMTSIIAATVDLASGSANVELAETGASGTVYLDPGVWNTAGARFQAWTWGGSGDAWMTFTDNDGDGIYGATVPNNNSTMILLKRESSHSNGSWDGNYSNRINDISIQTNNKIYRVTGESAGNWQDYSPTPVVVPASKFYIRGNFSGEWKDTEKFQTSDSENIGSLNLTIKKGNYEFKITDGNNWYGNNGTITDTCSGWVFSTNEGNCKFEATADGSYTFTFDTSTKKLTVTKTSKYTVTFTDYNDSQIGDVQTVTGGSNATAPSNPSRTGYTFNGWQKDGAGTVYTAAQVNAMAINANTTFKANYTINSHTVTVTANPSEGGTVSGGGTYDYGSEVTLTATAKDGYVFTSWTGLPTGATTSGNTASFTVTGNESVTANFTQVKTYTVDAASSNSDLGTVKASAAVVAKGGSVTLTATPQTKGVFVEWTVNGTKYTKAEVTISNVQADISAEATFREKSGTVNFESADTSQGTVSSAGGTVTYSSEASSTATPATGYDFKNWTVSSAGTVNTDYKISTGSINDPTIGVKILTDGTVVNLTANFEIKTYTVTFVDGAGNTLETDTVNHGAGATAPATNPTRQGYTFNGWDKTFNNITADTTVTAKWTANVYTVTVNQAAGGSASTSTESFTYSDSGSVTLTATPAEGYAFDGWTITGSYDIVSGTTSDATFVIRPYSNITASANFAKGQYLTIYSYSDSGYDKLTLTESNGTNTKTVLDAVTQPSEKVFGDLTWKSSAQLQLTNGYSDYVSAFLSGATTTSGNRIYVDFSAAGTWGSGHYLSITSSSNNGKKMQNGDTSGAGSYVPKSDAWLGSGKLLSGTTATYYWDIPSANQSNLNSYGFTVWASNEYNYDNVYQTDVSHVAYSSSSNLYTVGSVSTRHDDRKTDCFTMTPSGNLSTNSGDINLTSYLYTGSTWNNVSELWIYESDSAVTVTNRRALLDAVATAKANYDAGNGDNKWTADSWTAFTTAYNAAVAAINNKAATQSQIDSALSTLSAAALVPQSSSTVTFKENGASGGTIEGNTQVINGQTATFKVTAPAGYYVSAVSGSTITPGKEVTFTTTDVITSDTEITITYTANPTVTVNQTGGTVTGAGEVEYGKDTTVVITAPAGSYISGISGAEGGTYTNNNTVYTVQLTSVKADTAITVTYASNPVVTVTENENGTVTINGEEDNSSSVAYGSSPVVSIVAPEGYYISSITVNGANEYTGSDETKLNYTVNSQVTANTNIIVTYALRTKYTVTVEAYDDTKGTLKVNGVTVPASGNTVEVYGGTNVTVTATPVTGQTVDNWTVNGTQGHNGVLELILSNISENKTVSVAWKQESIYTVTVDTNPYSGGTATGTVISGASGVTSITSAKGGTQTTTVKENGSVTFTVTDTNPAYKFTGWKITGLYGNLTGKLSDTEITLVPKTNITVTAQFERAYKIIYLENELGWSQPYIHYWEGSESSSWPGVKMTKVDGSSSRWYAYVPVDTGKIQFNPGNNSTEVEYNINGLSKNTFSNKKDNSNYPANTTYEGIYLQGTWNGKDYSAYDYLLFDENRDGTYTITIDVTSAADGYIYVNPTDKDSKYYNAPSAAAVEGNSVTLNTTVGTKTNAVKIPLDMTNASNGYRITFTFNPETGLFSWNAVKKAETIFVYGTDGIGSGDTYFEVGGSVLGKETSTNYEKAEVAKNEYFTIYTQIDSATDSETHLEYEWYVLGYVINGKDFVYADSLGNGLYSASIRLSETESDIVPIYFHTQAYLDFYGIDTTTFYAVVPEGLKNWTTDKTYLSAYTWYYTSGNTPENIYSPFGTYPGQLMIPITGLDGVYYTIVENMAPGKNADNSNVYVSGVTLNNYNSTTPANEVTANIQTYDFYEFVSYAELKRENITFVLKNHNTNYNKPLVNGTSNITPGNFTFTPFVNYNNEITDIFGKVMTQAQYDAQVAAGNVLHVVRIGNKNYKVNSCGMEHPDGTCPLTGEWYVDAYIYDNTGNFIGKCHSYQLSNGDMAKILAPYSDYAVKVSYEKSTVVNDDGSAESNASDATRYDGEWYADTDNSVEVTISVNVALSTDDGKTFTIKEDAQGNKLNVAEYGTDLVNGKASVSVKRNEKITLYAQRVTGYRFVGWATADGKIFSTNISETVDVAIATSYTAIYQELDAGQFYLNHYIYMGEGTADKTEIPDAHNGRGDLYVQIENLTQKTDTGLLKQNSVNLAATEGDNLRITIATDPAGIDTFFAWYVNAIGLTGTTYEEVGVDSLDNLAMPGNGGTYTNPNTVIGETGLVYFQFNHTVGKQFNLTLYSDIIRVTSNKKLIYRYNDRNMGMKEYVVNYELTPDEIVGFEGNNFRPYTPSDAIITKYAPFVGDYYKDVDWVISDFSADECVLWGVNRTKYYSITSNIEGFVSTQQATYNSVVNYDASELGFTRGGFWYKDINGNLTYDEGVDPIIANGTTYSYRVTDNICIGYVSEKINDFTVSVDDPVYGREQQTDSNGNNKSDKVVVDYMVNMVTPNVYGDGSGFTPWYKGEQINDNWSGQMVTIESLEKAGYTVSFGVLLEQVDLNYVVPEIEYPGYDFLTFEEALADAQSHGYGTATENVGAILNSMTGTTKVQDGKYYINYNRTDAVKLTNKNRYLFTIELNNTLDNRAAFYNVYAYMTVTTPDGVTTTYISNVQTLNIHTMGTTNVA